MDNKVKHLEFIQGVINRMSGTSSLIKGWSLTVAAALLGFALKEEKAEALYLALVVAGVFWLLDAYFMKNERLYRSLYDEVRRKTEEVVDFSMNTSHLVYGKNTLFQTAFSPVLALFYFPIVICALILILNTN